MSGGEQQMLSVACTLMGQPRLVLLDEPSGGVAPADRRAVMARTVLELKAQGIGHLAPAEQNLPFAEVVRPGLCAGKGQIAHAGQHTSWRATRRHASNIWASETLVWSSVTTARASAGANGMSAAACRAAGSSPKIGSSASVKPPLRSTPLCSQACQTSVVQ